MTTNQMNSRVGRKQTERKGMVKRFASTKVGKITIASTVALSLFGGGTVGASLLGVKFDSYTADITKNNATQLSKKVNTLTTNYLNLRNNRDSIYDTKLQLANDITAKQAQLTALTKELTDLKANSITQAQLDAKVAEINTLKASITTMTAERDSLLTEVERVNAELTKANTFVNEVGVPINQATNKVMTFEVEQKTYNDATAVTEKYEYNPALTGQ